MSDPLILGCTVVFFVSYWVLNVTLGEVLRQAWRETRTHKRGVAGIVALLNWASRINPDLVAIIAAAVLGSVYWLSL